MYIFHLAPKPSPRSGYLWTMELEAPSNSSPALANGILYTGSGNKLLAIDTQDQEIQWVFETGDIIRSSPALTGSAVIVGSQDGYLYSVDINTGEKLWGIKTEDKITSSPAVSDLTVYVGSHDGNLYAIE